MIEAKLKNITLLSNIQINKKVRIYSLKNDIDTKLFLFSLGILPGDEVEIINKAPFGDPIYLKHSKSNFFTIRKSQAKFIEVEV